MRVAIINIATGPYLELWKKLVPELDDLAFLGNDVTVHILTDNPEEARATLTNRIAINVHEVPPYRWPDATLRRYQMIEGISSDVHADIVMYLDVDMHLVRQIGQDLDANQWEGGLACAAHPGYFRRSGLAGLIQLAAHPRALCRDLLTRIRRGTPPGAWSDDPNSLAFVPASLRKTYVHGAIWAGRSHELFEMCRELAARTQDDTDRGVMAKWHDESHLNWFFAHNKVSLLPQSYSCVEGWWQTRDIEASIVSVQKGDGYR